MCMEQHASSSTAVVRKATYQICVEVFSLGFLVRIKKLKWAEVFGPDLTPKNAGWYSLNKHTAELLVKDLTQTRMLVLFSFSLAVLAY